MDNLDSKEPERKGENEKLKGELVKVYARLLPEELKKSSRPVDVVSIGCGHFAQEVTAVCSNIPKARYLGIDIALTPVAIQIAAVEYAKYGARLVKGDAAETSTIGDAPIWDLAILRNPHIGSASTSSGMNLLWESIISNTIDGIKPGGYLLLSGMTEDEFDRSLSYAEKAGRLQTVKRETPIEPPIDSRFPMVERQIALLQKKV